MSDKVIRKPTNRMLSSINPKVIQGSQRDKETRIENEPKTDKDGTPARYSGY